MSDSRSQNKKGLSQLRYGKISRTLDVLGLMIGSGQKALSYKIQSQLSSSSKENLALEILKKQIEVLASRLGHLKGGLMKIGQMLSVYGEYFLPPELNQTLKSLQDKSPPFEWEILKAILIKNFGDDIFKHVQVETSALASASIGQVHKAIITENKTPIIFKIQYPNIEKAIESDLMALKSIFKVVELFPNISHMELLFDEVESMLKQELDYINEMNWSKKYYKYLQQDSRFIVPQIFPEYTSTKILAASYEEGISVDSPQVQNLSQELRNQLAQNMLEQWF
jgi:predicted unusual protein kinase regulating ubiquinone biosynthesis (AarF/ABC1/UbiB family)